MCEQFKNLFFFVRLAQQNLLCLNVGILFVCAQNDGRYRPLSSLVTEKPVVINDGRYRPSNDGRYVIKFIRKAKEKSTVMHCRYNPANDGKYRPGNDGKYIHMGDKDRGQYTGGGGEYTGGFGKYNGGNAQTDFQIYSKVDVKLDQPTVKPKVNPYINNGGWKIIRDERTEDTDGYHYL